MHWGRRKLRLDKSRSQRVSDKASRIRASDSTNCQRFKAKPSSTCSSSATNGCAFCLQSRVRSSSTRSIAPASTAACWSRGGSASSTSAQDEIGPSSRPFGCGPCVCAVAATMAVSRQPGSHELRKPGNAGHIERLASAAVSLKTLDPALSNDSRVESDIAGNVSSSQYCPGRAAPCSTRERTSSPRRVKTSTICARATAETCSSGELCGPQAGSTTTTSSSCSSARRALVTTAEPTKPPPPITANCRRCSCGRSCAKWPSRSWRTPEIVIATVPAAPSTNGGVMSMPALPQMDGRRPASATARVLRKSLATRATIARNRSGSASSSSSEWVRAYTSPRNGPR
mmetsp:Transcript_47332/g.143940  ORF Transcript_47332/g.143940 Transcript_47332/m.143940 type:complete len:343 (+) Transcript_47332:247-1275(+)